MPHPPTLDRHPDDRGRPHLSLLIAAGLALVAVVGLTAACERRKDPDVEVASLDTAAKQKADENEEDSGSGDGAGDATEEERQDAMLEFAACMREHGVDMPDPEMSADGGVRIAVEAGSAGAARGGPDSAEMEKMEAANEACEPIMEGVFGEPEPMSPEDQAKFRDEQLAYAKCMREHGVDMPDPEISFEGGKTRIDMAGGGGAPIDPESTTFQDANEACGAMLGEGRIAVAGGPGGGSGGKSTMTSGGDE